MSKLHPIFADILKPFGGEMSDGVAPSKGAWTPGPWRVCLQESRLMIFGPDDRSYWALVELNKHGMVGNEAEANALLISKSPQMAEALQKLTGLIRDCRNVYQNHAAEWLMKQPSYTEAERLLSELEVKPQHSNFELSEKGKP